MPNKKTIHKQFSSYINISIIIHACELTNYNNYIKNLTMSYTTKM